jgi:hypothetical protein
MPLAIARRLVPAAVALTALTVLGGCGVAQDAQDAVDSATAGAKQQAADTARDIAVRTLTGQACELTKDGTLSREDVRRLTGQLDAARAAGVPDEVLNVVRPLIEQGAGAGEAEVNRLRAAACG